MKKQETNKSLSALALERTKKTLDKKSTVLAWLSIFVLASLALAFLSPLTLIVTIPLVVAPSVFAFMAVNTAVDQNVPSGTSSFFILYRLYFTSNFHGCFKLIINFLKAMLCFLALSFVCSIVGSIVLYNVNPEISKTVTQIVSIKSQEAMMEEFNNFLVSSNPFTNLVEVITYVALGGSYLFFVHCTMVDGFKYYLNFLSAKPMFARDLNVIFSVTYKKIKKDFRKEYWKVAWLAFLALALGFAGGIVLGKFVFNLEPAMTFIVGLFVSFVVIIPFIPFYFDFTVLLFKKYQSTFINTFIDLSIETINEIKKKEQIPPEKEKEMMDFLNKQKEENSKKDKDEKNHD